MKKILTLLCAILLLCGTAVAEDVTYPDVPYIEDENCFFFSLPAQSGNVYEVAQVMNTFLGDIPLDMEKLEGHLIPLADALDAAMLFLQDKLHMEKDAQVFIAQGFYDNYSVIQGRCYRFLVYTDRSAQYFYELLVDMDQQIRLCQLHVNLDQ